MYNLTLEPIINRLVQLVIQFCCFKIVEKLVDKNYEFVFDNTIKRSKCVQIFFILKIKNNREYYIVGLI